MVLEENPWWPCILKDQIFIDGHMRIMPVKFD